MSTQVKKVLNLDMLLMFFAAFVGGLINEYVMREMYKARMKAEKKTVTEASTPLASYTAFLGMQENWGGLAIGILILIAGMLTPVKMLKYVGAGSLGYFGGKFMNNCILPTVTVS